MLVSLGHSSLKGLNPGKVQACPACRYLGVDMALGEVLLLARGRGDDVELYGLLLSSHDGALLLFKEKILVSS